MTHLCCGLESCATARGSLPSVEVSRRHARGPSSFFPALFITPRGREGCRTQKHVRADRLYEYLPLIPAGKKR